MSALSEATRYLENGFSVVAVRADGSKAPLVPWKDYQRERITREKLEEWWGEETADAGIGIIGGEISGGLEILDFDNPAFFESWRDLIETHAPDILRELPTVRTPSGGIHVYYRAEESEGNLKLAWEQICAPGDPEGKAGDYKIAIETRGEGGYVLVPGSPADCHPSHREYETVSDAAIEATPRITATDRDLLLSFARSLNEKLQAKNVASITKQAAAGAGGTRPGDKYNAEGEDWSVLLERNSWTLVGGRGDTAFWRRPGKERGGISATVSYCISEINGALLYVFSSNAAPFEGETAYTKFTALTLLEHGGDFNAAGKALVSQGFGIFELDPATYAEVSEELKLIRDSLDTEIPREFPGSKIDAFCDNLPKFKKTWEMKRDDFGADYHRYDSSLIWYGVRTGLSTAQLCLMVVTFRRRRKIEDEKTYDAAYLTRKVHFARTSKDEKTADKEVEKDERREEIDGAEDPAVPVRASLELDSYSHLIKDGKERCMYSMALTDGSEVLLGRASALFTQSSVRDALADALSHLVPKMKAFEWELLVGTMLRNAVERENLPTRSAEFCETMVDFVRATAVSQDDYASAVQQEAAFVRNERFYFRLRTLKAHLVAQFSKLTDSDIRLGLAGLGFQQKTVSYRIDDKVSSRSYFYGPLQEALETRHRELVIEEESITTDGVPSA